MTNRILACLLPALGCYFLGLAANAERSGVATVRGRTGVVETVRRDENLKRFRGLMIYKWASGVLPVCGGLMIFGLIRRTDRTDASSPDFAGSSSVDELERVLKEKEERQHRPLR